MRTAYHLAFCCLLGATLWGCERATIETPATPVSLNAALCESAATFTAIDVGAYTIKLFEPNEAKAPDIWQGPLCIESQSMKVACGFDLSLIKRVTPSSDGQAIEVITFSGSNSYTTRITLSTCHSGRVN